ncbi:MAG: glucan endo-1,3-beta-D-glucosidase [Robiginitomaculum sp.]|nr:MAG: glucan endo-1,3-beta-D-glucosidase [Robiginitomaculum sp.]
MPISACTAQKPVPETPQISNAKWTLVWSDEFEDREIDTDKWSFETDCWGGGNEERQCYTDSKENARVRNGNLEIIAKREMHTGYALPQRSRRTDEDAKKNATKPYTSARLRTIGKGDWRYGRIEVRAKLPGGQGVWPAIWMLPSDEHYGTWAASGEIDLMEAVNLGVACAECEGGYENHILGTLHYGDKWPDNAHTDHNTSINPLDAYHTYTIEWSAGEIKWFADDELYARQTHEGWYSAGVQAQGRPFAPFDQRFHLILNVAIGGGLAEGRNAGGVNKEGFPKTMFVDWVRVYECASDRETGLACQIGNAK